MVAEEDPEKIAPWRPEPEQFTLMHELLAQIRDRQGDIAALLADLPTTVKQRRSPPASFPRPQTELDKARARRDTERDEEYMAGLEDFVTKAKANWRRHKEAEGG